MLLILPPPGTATGTATTTCAGAAIAHGRCDVAVAAERLSWHGSTKVVAAKPSRPPISPLYSQFMPKRSFPVVSSFSAWCAHVSSKRTTWRSSSHLVDLSNDRVAIQCNNPSMPTFESPAFLIPASTV